MCIYPQRKIRHRYPTNVNRTNHEDRSEPQVCYPYSHDFCKVATPNSIYPWLVQKLIYESNNSLVVLTSTTTTEAVSATLAPSPSSEPAPSDRLPTTTMVAIGVVIPIVVITTAALLFYIFRKKQKSRQAVVQRTSMPPSQIEPYTKAELPSDTPQAELHSHSSRGQLHELQ